MGWYINFTDVANRYANFPVKAGAGATEAEPVIRGAEAEVDAALAGLYPTPFTPGSSNAPYLVRDICIDLTYWKAVGWQNEKLGPIMRAYIDKRLKDINEGKVQLTNSAGLVMQSAPFAGATSDNSVRSSFGMDDPIRWSVSSAWQDDYSAARIGDGSDY
jgi:hypothetical protein